MCLGYGGVGGVWGVSCWLGPRSGRVEWYYVCVCCESGFFVAMAGLGICVLCSAYLRCTQCSIVFHLIDICFLTCICLWQISQIQAFWVLLSDLD